MNADSAQPMMSPDAVVPGDGVLPSQQNWLMKIRGDTQPSDLITYEYRLYSDAHITGEYRTTEGPYAFLNTVPMPGFGEAIKTPVVLRAEMHLRNAIPDMSQTDESLYHGGHLVDEIVSIASLSLGVRLMNGGLSRQFGMDGDPYGRPCEWSREPRPAYRIGRVRSVLPSVGNSHSMGGLRRLESIPRIDPKRFLSLVRACKSYLGGLWIADTDPNMAWLLFVSALETAANDVFGAGSDAVELLRSAKRDLVERLEEIGGLETLNLVAVEFAHTLKSTMKFIDFAMKFMPEPPDDRPKGEALRLNWSEANLRKVLGIVYRYRSRALHAGVPFPAPMFEPPFVAQANEPGSEVPLIGLGAYSSGGTWIPKDVPINLHAFHYITRHALLNWWERELVQARDA